MGEEKDSVALSVINNEIDSLERNIHGNVKRIEEIKKNCEELRNFIEKEYKRYRKENPAPAWGDEYTLWYVEFQKSETNKLSKESRKRIFSDSLIEKELVDDVQKCQEELRVLKKIRKKLKGSFEVGMGKVCGTCKDLAQTTDGKAVLDLGMTEYVDGDGYSEMYQNLMEVTYCPECGKKAIQEPIILTYMGKETYSCPTCGSSIGYDMDCWECDQLISWEGL